MQILMVEGRTLSEREIEVLQTLWDTDGDKDVTAKLLVLQYRTLTTHLANIYAVLGVSTIAQAVIKAVKMGLIETEAADEARG